MSTGTLELAEDEKKAANSAAPEITKEEKVTKVKRGPGRPKKTEAETDEVTKIKRGPGRPPGSKNKTKPVEKEGAVTEVRRKPGRPQKTSVDNSSAASLTVRLVQQMAVLSPDAKAFVKELINQA